MKLSLLTEDGMVVPDAAARILAHLIFPKDADSRRQALMIAHDEARRFLEAGSEKNYRESELTRALIEYARGTAGQRGVAGYTAIAFMLLNDSKKRTLYAAATIVERALKRASKKDPEPLKMLHLREGEWRIDGQRCPMTRGGIERAWVEYCEVSHLLAAEEVLAELFPVQTVFARPPEYSALLLRTAAAIEPYISAAVEKRGKCLLQVSHQMTGPWETLQPVLPGAGLWEFLRQGLDRKSL